MYDIVIIGAGPAGLTAGIYAARYNLKALIIGEILGGYATEAFKICNFPTYKELTGVEFAQKMGEQVKALGVEVKMETVNSVEKKKSGFLIKADSKEYEARKIILACGTKKRKLGVEGEEQFEGRGISYCATCDGPLFKNKVVGVVGGGNSALTSALLLSKHAKKVYIIYRKDNFFRADPAWVDLAEKNKKIESIFNSTIAELSGGKFLEKIKLNSGKELKLEGLFVEIGSIPCVDFAKMLGLKLDEEGYIAVDRKQKTSVSGVFAAGDATNPPLKQIITAAAQGAVASQTVFEELQKE
jgi:thioredoxin reductase (NADPH)